MWNKIINRLTIIAYKICQPCYLYAVTGICGMILAVLYSWKHDSFLAIVWSIIAGLDMGMSVFEWRIKK